MAERAKGPLDRRKKKKKEDLRPLIYIRFISYHRIEKKKGGRKLEATHSRKTEN